MVQFEIIQKYMFKHNIWSNSMWWFNVNFLENSSEVNQIISLFQMYNLFRFVDFPTRITKKSSTAIDCVMYAYQVAYVGTAVSYSSFISNFNKIFKSWQKDKGMF
jgi:hypothetical protein